MANRLIDEQSPYLQQHAHNPVEWYPWGDEAFERAKNEQKPVLVSIGYAACHWCHVMERESFEDEATAAYMNEHYINIKVDREEHPDVDHMYMDAVQAITQQGGWPLNVFVTPERIPFYGGTYFPPKPLYSRPSWMQVLQQINKIWTTERGEVTMQTDQMQKYLEQISAVAMNKGELWTEDASRKVADSLLAAADKQYGGFGGAPKFPAVQAIVFLLEHYHFTGYEPALEHALKSLDSMAEGGIYDQLGGGFARYSTDVKWLAPHFEKMLYDNALLIAAYADAYTITKKEMYRRVVAETVDFVNRELKSEEGGFYCALDADSEGVEGKFYTWTWEEWQQAVGRNPALEAYFGIEEGGNWEHTNILHIAMSIDDVASEYGVQVEEFETRINEVKKQLFSIRSARIRPATDDKCLMSWNAMMNIALAKAGAAFERQDWLQQAAIHMNFLRQNFNRNGIWYHTMKDGVAKIDAKLDDMSYMIASMLQLAAVSGDTTLIVAASEIMKDVQVHFLHENKSFFYFTSVLQKDIPVRKTELYDGSVPSSNSVMAANLVWLGMLMERSDWIEQGQFMMHQMVGPAQRYGSSFANWSVGGQRLVRGYKTAVVTGKEAEMTAAALRKELHPNGFVISPGDGSTVVPVLADKVNYDQNAVFICDATSCLNPTSDLQTVSSLLKNKL